MVCQHVHRNEQRPNRKGSGQTGTGDDVVMPSDILELLSEASDGAYAVDMNQRIIFWNRSAERILGHKAEEVLGQRCYWVLGGRSEEEVPVCASDCAAVLWARLGKVAPSHTFLTRARDGKSMWLSITHVLLPSARPELSTLVHIFHEVTQEVEAKRLVQHLSSMLSRGAEVLVPVTIAAPEAHDGVDNLSPRELEVLRLLARGLGTKSIAAELSLSAITVRNHIQRILTKLDVHTRLEAVAAASRRGLL